MKEAFIIRRIRYTGRPENRREGVMPSVDHLKVMIPDTEIRGKFFHPTMTASEAERGPQIQQRMSPLGGRT